MNVLLQILWSGRITKNKRMGDAIQKIFGNH